MLSERHTGTVGNIHHTIIIRKVESLFTMLCIYMYIYIYTVEPHISDHPDALGSRKNGRLREVVAYESSHHRKPKL